MTPEEGAITVSLARQNVEQSAPVMNKEVMLDEAVPLQESQWDMSVNAERELIILSR